MTGADIVALAETFTGRTTESAKMLTRANVCLREIYASHEFDFNIGLGSMVLEAIQTGLSLTFSNTIATFGGAATLQTSAYATGGWLNLASRSERYMVYASPNGGLLIRPAAKFTGTADATWFKTDWSLQQAGTSPDANSSVDFGRLIEITCDKSGLELEVITEGEYTRRYGTVDVGTTGEPRVCCMTTVLRSLNALTVVRELGVRLWPIPDARYTLNYKYRRVPTDITLTSSPELGSAQFHDTLAWGAAYLTRLDDADTTWQWFYQQYQKRIADLKWFHATPPNANQRALGPRDGNRSIDPKGWF